jgi:hypothetical protein
MAGHPGYRDRYCGLEYLNNIGMKEGAACDQQEPLGSYSVRRQFPWAISHSVNASLVNRTRETENIGKVNRSLKPVVKAREDRCVQPRS